MAGLKSNKPKVKVTEEAAAEESDEPVVSLGGEAAESEATESTAAEETKPELSGTDVEGAADKPMKHTTGKAAGSKPKLVRISLLDNILCAPIIGTFSFADIGAFSLAKGDQFTVPDHVASHLVSVGLAVITA
jgi:hypothetical protein